jgi:thioredoxin 1
MKEDLNFSTFFEMVSGHRIVLIDAYAFWCEPCQRFLKLVPRLEEMLVGRAVFGKFDVEKEPLLKQMYEITKVPTFLFFVDDKLVYKETGKIMTLTEIDLKIEELTNLL